jgi:hypothetical protein
MPKAIDSRQQTAARARASASQAKRLAEGLFGPSRDFILEVAGELEQQANELECQARDANPPKSVTDRPSDDSSSGAQHTSLPSSARVSPDILARVRATNLFGMVFAMWGSFVLIGTL